MKYVLLDLDKAVQTRVIESSTIQASPNTRVVRSARPKKKKQFGASRPGADRPPVVSSAAFRRSLSPELLKALPKPGEGQSEKEFIASCMSNDKMKDEFPDNDQRVAVCYSQWEGPEKAKKSLTLGGMFKAWSAEARAAAAEARRGSKREEGYSPFNPLSSPSPSFGGPESGAMTGQLATAEEMVRDRPSRKLAKPVDWKRRMKQEELLAPNEEQSSAERKLIRDYVNKRLTRSLTSGPMTLAKAWEMHLKAASNWHEDENSRGAKDYDKFVGRKKA